MYFAIPWKSIACGLLEKLLIINRFHSQFEHNSHIGIAMMRWVRGKMKWNRILYSQSYNRWYNENEKIVHEIFVRSTYRTTQYNPTQSWHNSQYYSAVVKLKLHGIARIIFFSVLFCCWISKQPSPVWWIERISCFVWFRLATWWMWIERCLRIQFNFIFVHDAAAATDSQITIATDTILYISMNVVQLAHIDISHNQSSMGGWDEWNEWNRTRSHMSVCVNWKQVQAAIAIRMPSA